MELSDVIDRIIMKKKKRRAHVLREIQELKSLSYDDMEMGNYIKEKFPNRIVLKAELYRNSTYYKIRIGPVNPISGAIIRDGENLKYENNKFIIKDNMGDKTILSYDVKSFTKASEDLGKRLQKVDILYFSLYYNYKTGANELTLDEEVCKYVDSLREEQKNKKTEKEDRIKRYVSENNVLDRMIKRLGDFKDLMNKEFGIMRRDGPLGKGYYLVYGEDIVYKSNEVGFTKKKGGYLSIHEVKDPRDDIAKIIEGEFVNKNISMEYFTESGFPIPKEDADIYFEQMKSNKIMYRDGKIRILKRKKRKSGISEGNKIEFRTEMQQYLMQNKPDYVEMIKLGTSTGGIIYHFGNLTIVEPNKIGASYLYDAKRFPELMNLKRSVLLEERPEGFIGRIYHGEKWQDKIDDAILEHGYGEKG